MATVKTRTKPNILITGTPGTGKTSLCGQIAESLHMNHVEVGKLVEKYELHDGWDDEFGSWILNEDKLCDEMDKFMDDGNQLIDFHSCEFFPERYFDLVVVLRTENDLLWKRLEKRGYKPNKIKENAESEIFQVVLDEARDSYPENIVLELESNTPDDMESNVLKIAQFISSWTPTQRTVSNNNKSKRQNHIEDEEMDEDDD